MRQAIITKYLGPTNHRGARIKVKCNAFSMTVPWDYAMGAEKNHEFAAQLVFKKLGWDKYGTLVGGWVMDCGVFVQVGNGKSMLDDYIKKVRVQNET